MGYKLFVQTSGRIARIVPSSSKPTVAERVFGELSTEDALANQDTLEDAIRAILADRGITDGDTYSITLPDNLQPPKSGSDVEDRKGPLAEVEKDHKNGVVNDTDLITDSDAQKAKEARLAEEKRIAEVKAAEKADKKAAEAKAADEAKAKDAKEGDKEKEA